MFRLRLSCLVAVFVVWKGASGQRPNFIVMQPDDLAFFEEWLPPAHFPTNTDTFRYNSFGLPNLDRLRNRGLHMTQAYTASPVCGTSRYSTITGRYPSRSSASRSRNSGAPISAVTIPTTKLVDIGGVVDGNDCSENNVAAILKANGYRTGVTGKWHLARTNDNYNYDAYTADIRSCGFDFAEAIYAENLNGFFNDGSFSHNLEFVADRAISFIKENPSQPFFLYVNPTAPHGSGSVAEALTDFSCTDTPEGRIASEPVIPGMTAEVGSCSAYRQTLFDRAGGSSTQNNLGAIWVDDVVGALFRALEDIGQLENTFFLFQLDHGNEGKGTLWEPGVRLAQFVHFPDAFGTGGRSWEGLVSTIDIVPTILDFAGVQQNGPGYYQMDGMSWRSAVLSSQELEFWRDERCLAFELETDRAIRCGCNKYLSLETTGTTFRRANRSGVVRSTETLFNLCGNGRTEIKSPGSSPEAISSSNGATLEALRIVNQAHVARTVASRSPLDFSPLQSLPSQSSPPTLRPSSASVFEPTVSPTSTPTASLATSVPARPTDPGTSSPVSVPTASPHMSPDTMAPTISSLVSSLGPTATTSPPVPGVDPTPSPVPQGSIPSSSPTQIPVVSFSKSIRASHFDMNLNLLSQGFDVGEHETDLSTFR